LTKQSIADLNQFVKINCQKKSDGVFYYSVFSIFKAGIASRNEVYMSASMTLTPSVATVHNPLTITATNTGTGTWTRFTNLTVSGGTNPRIIPNSTSIAYTLTPQVLTCKIDPGISAGTLTITNSTDASTASLVVSVGHITSPEPYPLPGASITETSFLEFGDFTVRPGNVILSSNG
jgi:hypothetical protein